MSITGCVVVNDFHVIRIVERYANAICGYRVLDNLYSVGRIKRNPVFVIAIHRVSGNPGVGRLIENHAVQVSGSIIADYPVVL
uniref:Uncharacterized protein n=1 Tax=Candidatus Methanophaga sp. ANME-1 ERB7 TaxID=2759913 RepID=A0A7G9Z1R3_9EURY|nr:hypothetical protein PCEKAPCC_00001 [Methanosarcinales archaeon ANME-1 ERB7]